MLTLSSPDIPVSGTSQQWSMIPSASSDGVPVVMTGNVPISPLEISKETTTAVVNGNIQIAVANSIATPVEIAIGTNTYYPAVDSQSPQPGEFTFDAGTGTAIVIPIDIINPGSIATYTGLQERYIGAIPTNQIPSEYYPQFFRDWNIQGDISFNRSFKGHPSGNVKFAASASEESRVRSQLKNGTKLFFNGSGYITSNLQITQLSDGTIKNNIILVQINLTGCWASFGSPPRSPLDKPVKLKSLGVGTGTISTMASRIGVTYSGAPINIKLPTNMPTDAVSTVRAELESRAIVSGAFPYYSNGNAIETRVFGSTRMHFLSDADVLSETISYNLPGFGYNFAGLQLTHELNACVLNLASDGDSASGGDETFTLVEGDPSPKSPPKMLGMAPPDRQMEATGEWGESSLGLSLRDPSMAYPSGPTKSQTITTYVNGTVTKKQEIVYGFCFASVDLWNLTPSGNTFVPQYAGGGTVDQVYWKKCKDVTTTHNFTASYGYLQNTSTRGFSKYRHKEETNAKESLMLRKKILDAQATGGLPKAEYDAIQAEIEMYRTYVDLPVKDETIFNLVSFRAYYPDIPEPDPEDKNYIEPMFAKKVERSDSSYSLKPDPSSTKEEPKPPLSTGKSFKETTAIEIVYPRVSANKPLEMYKVKKETYNSEGSGFQNVLHIGSSSEVKGRPSPHQRLNLSGTREAKTPSSPLFKYRLYTPGFTPSESDPDQGSMSFPDVSDPEIGRKAAQSQISIENSQNTEQITTKKVI